MSYEIEPRVCINGENAAFCGVYRRDAEGHAVWMADVDADTPEKALEVLRGVQSAVLAPDLLEALTGLLAQVEQYGHRAENEAARAAIAKARGGAA